MCVDVSERSDEMEVRVHASVNVSCICYCAATVSSGSGAINLAISYYFTEIKVDILKC